MPGLGPHGMVLEIEEAFLLVKALAKCGIPSVSAVIPAIESAEVKAVVRRYADTRQGALDPEAASARVLLGAVIGVRDRRLFDSIRSLQDPALMDALG